MSHADRNLLFGILAVQMNFVARDALIAAMHAWVLERSKPLGRILVEQQALSPARECLLDQLVHEHLAAHDGDAEKSLAATDGLEAICDELKRFADPVLDATVNRALSAAGVTQNDPDATFTFPHGAPAAGSRFSILRPHARGGLGQVSVALDAELNREVALKELRPERADDPDSRARFLLEAEVTGRLEHPGVVPVYGLGWNGKGQPFYAMRLVKGETLKDAIDRFHARQHGIAGDVRQWNLALRQLLNRFISVCNVMDYAHSRGVIHRDLKPANILMGPYGETLVVDWGLAKVVGRGEAADRATAAEGTLQPAAGSGSSETLPGTAMGTPAYMSPEQAEGRLDRIGPLSDVYSLGATLYCLLTGQPPIDEPDVAEVLRKIKAGAIVAPRQRNGRVPAALEAICRKAMAVESADRYSTPRALADEIEHWLADEPVSCFREPVTVRLTRWGRRHRTLASSIGVLLVTAVVGLSVATALIRGEQVKTGRLQKIAEGNALEAGQRAEALRRKDYVNRINLAQREVLDDNIALAEDLLEGCPADLRGWEWDYVRRLYHKELLTYRGHIENVRCLKISPDGEWVATGDGLPWRDSRESDRAEVRVWNADTGQERWVFRGLMGAVQAVAFSADGKLVAAGGGCHLPEPRGWLQVWDVATGKPVWDQPVAGTTVMSLAFHPKDRYLAVAYGLFSARYHTGYVRLHRLDDGAPLGTAFGEQAGGVNAVAFDHEGCRVALAGLERIEIWDPVTRIRVLPPLTGHAKYVYCVAFHPDGKRLASGGWDNTIRLWDLDTGATTQSILGHRGFVLEIAFSPDGTGLASTSEDNSVRLWEVGTGRELVAFHGHARFVYALAFHPDGRRIISGSLDGTVKVWDAITSHSVVFRGHSTWVTGVAFSRDGRRVVSKRDGAHLVAAGLASGGFDETKVWNPSTGVEERTADPPASGSNAEFERGGAIGDFIARSPDGRRIVRTGPQGLGLEVVDEATNAVLFPLKGHIGYVKCVAFAPDGRRIATAGWEDRTIKLWDVADGREVLTLRGHTASVLCVAFSPDGRRLASGSIDNTARIWDARPLDETAEQGPSVPVTPQ